MTLNVLCYLTFCICTAIFARDLFGFFRKHPHNAPRSWKREASRAARSLRKGLAMAATATFIILVTTWSITLWLHSRDCRRAGVPL